MSNFGQLTTSHVQATGGPTIPSEFHAFVASPDANGGAAGLDDKTVADQAVADSKNAPSIWFANFPNKEAAGAKKTLASYMQHVENYRCWASLIWWKTVYQQMPSTKGETEAAQALRTSYCARVALKHMQLTPWLAMNSNNNESKDISCNITEFHTELINAVLEGFVVPDVGIYQALEQILDSLRKTISTSDSSSSNRTIVCERYEYVKEADAIVSYVRIISFAVDDNIKSVQSHKATENDITCKITYDDYEAVFNQKLWATADKDISAAQMTATKDFVNQQTVDCPP